MTHHKTSPQKDRVRGAATTKRNVRYAMPMFSLLITQQKGKRARAFREWQRARRKHGPRVSPGKSAGEYPMWLTVPMVPTDCTTEYVLTMSGIEIS